MHDQQQQQHLRQPTTNFVHFRTHQAGIVARNCCYIFNQANLKDIHWSGRLLVKFKIYAAKSFLSGFCDCACLMSPDKDETGRRLSRMLLLLVVRWSSLFASYGEKHFNFVDKGRKKYWLKLIKRAKRLKFLIELTMS